jgi:hypothetical protein
MPERRADVESVDWAALEVHGEPAEVPAAFREIWSANENRRRAGYNQLVELLGHGMSSSPAAIAAVPFLTDVVADPGAPSRFAACQVLLQIAIGEEEITLNERPDFAFWRREAERKAGLTVEQLLAEQAAWVAAATDPEERRAREVAVRFRDVEEERTAERVNAEAYDAVRAGVPVYLTALSAADTATQIYAAQLLAYFPEDAPMIVPELLELVAGDDPVAAAAAAVAAGICARGTEDPAAVAALTMRWAGARDLVLRCATAIGLAQMLNRPSPEILADVETATEAPDPIAGFPFMGGDIAAVAGYTLDRIEGLHRLPSGPWAEQQA